MSASDIFVYGALVALCGNRPEPARINPSNLMTITGFSQLELISVIKRLESKSFLKAIWFDDHLYLQIAVFTPDLIKVAA